MNTPAHLIFGTAAFGKVGNWRVTTAAMLGSIAPDISLYLMSGWSIFIRDVSPHTVFREYYFSSEWQRVFAVDNSFVLWGVLFVIALWTKRPVVVAFAGAGILHLCLDFPFHNQDARMHFWPLTDWIFKSPLSYWDHRHYAGIVGPAELMLALSMCLMLLLRYKRLVSRLLIFLLAGLEVAASGFFGWFL